MGRRWHFVVFRCGTVEQQQPVRGGSTQSTALTLPSQTQNMGVAIQLPNGTTVTRRVRVDGQLLKAWWQQQQQQQQASLSLGTASSSSTPSAAGGNSMAGSARARMLPMPSPVF